MTETFNSISNNKMQQTKYNKLWTNSKQYIMKYRYAVRNQVD